MPEAKCRPIIVGSGFPLVTHTHTLSFFAEPLPPRYCRWVLAFQGGHADDPLQSERGYTSGTKDSLGGFSIVMGRSLDSPEKQNHNKFTQRNKICTIAIASDLRVEGAKSPEIPQKEWGFGLGNRNSKSQIASDFPSHP